MSDLYPCRCYTFGWDVPTPDGRTERRFVVVDRYHEAEMLKDLARRAGLSWHIRNAATGEVEMGKSDKIGPNYRYLFVWLQYKPTGEPFLDSILLESYGLFTHSKEMVEAVDRPWLLYDSRSMQLLEKSQNREFST